MRVLEGARRLLEWALTPITPGARRAVVFLFAFTLAVAIVNLLWTAHQVGADDARWHQAIVTDDAHWHQALSDSQHKFCGVVGEITSVPAARPADPARAPVQERQYEWYQRFLALGQGLGC